MYYVSAQGVDERMLNVHYYYKCKEPCHIQLRRCIRVNLFVNLSILQAEFTEKGFKKSEKPEHSAVLLLLLFTLD